MERDRKNHHGLSHSSGDCLDPVGARRSSGPCGSRGCKVSEGPCSQALSNPISTYTRPLGFLFLCQPFPFNFMSCEVT